MQSTFFPEAHCTYSAYYQLQTLQVQTPNTFITLIALSRSHNSQGLFLKSPPYIHKVCLFWIHLFTRFVSHKGHYTIPPHVLHTIPPQTVPVFSGKTLEHFWHNDDYYNVKGCKVSLLNNLMLLWASAPRVKSLVFHKF